MEQFIQFDDGATAFVTGVKPNHECDDKGDPYLEFYNHEPMTQSQFDALSPEEQEKLNPSMGSVTCSICGAPYIFVNNPWYLDF
jgi:hypothetical protein